MTSLSLTPGEKLTLESILSLNFDLFEKLKSKAAAWEGVSGPLVRAKCGPSTLCTVLMYVHTREQGRAKSCPVVHTHTVEFCF